MSDDPELEELRKKRLAELQGQQNAQAEMEARKAEMEAQKKLILRQILTPKARDRLTNIKIARPEFAESLENQLITLAQRSNLRGPVTEKQLIEILRRLQSGKREREIKFKRK
ncbi:MAG: DNA-binding protein [Asgard group archaeon]|nr:DNA-binding protein [Asgard group archaeon]